MLGAAALAASAMPALAQQSGLEPRETAVVHEKGWVDVGAFNPLTIGLGHGLEVRAQPLLFLVAPNAVLRVGHLQRRSPDGGWWLTGEYGLSVPTVGLRLMQSSLFPTWDYDGGKIGWFLVPRAALLLTRTAARAAVTLAADLAVGIPLTHNDARPTQSYAPLELLLAPVLRGFRARVGALADLGLENWSRRLRLRGYGDAYLEGGEREKAYSTGHPAWGIDGTSIIVRVGIGADVGIGRSGPASRYNKRLALGVALYNYDQHAIDPTTFERHRSNDVYPTLDFIWQRW